MIYFTKKFAKYIALTFKYFSYIIQLRLRTSHTVLGLVLVSTGVLKLGKPSAGRDRVTIRILKLNANEKLAFAA